jgi:hypothetical protein
MGLTIHNPDRLILWNAPPRNPPIVTPYHYEWQGVYHPKMGQWLTVSLSRIPNPNGRYTICVLHATGGEARIQLHSSYIHPHIIQSVLDGWI